MSEFTLTVQDGILKVVRGKMKTFVPVRLITSIDISRVRCNATEITIRFSGGMPILLVGEGDLQSYNAYEAKVLEILAATVA